MNANCRAQSIVDCWFLGFQNAFTISGVATRKEYWSFVLINSLIGFTLAVLVGSITGNPASMPIPIKLLDIALIIPNFTILVRRLHDTERSGWWQLIALLPIAGTIILLLFTLQGSIRPNRYLTSD